MITSNALTTVVTLFFSLMSDVELKVVAVTTPTASIPPARTLIPDLAVMNPTESILVTSS